jgi:hypothetical protein
MRSEAVSHFLVIVTGLIYMACAVDQWLKGATGTAAIMFAGYAAANAGVYLQAK